MELLILLVLLYFFRGVFSEVTEQDTEDFITMDIIADGEFDGDIT